MIKYLFLIMSVLTLSVPVYADGSTTRSLAAAEITAIKNAVENQLKDPGSAQFKWPKLQLVGGTKDRLQGESGLYSYCGLVNAKNSYGGYIGYLPYYVGITGPEAGGLIAIVFGIASADLSDSRSQAIVEMCSNYGYRLAEMKNINRR